MLAEVVSNIKVKYVVLGAVATIGIVLLIMGLTGGFIFVRSNSETVTGFSQRSDSTDAPKDPLTIGKGGWKLVYLGLGDYRIEVSSGNKKTLYQPSVGMFSFQTLDVKLKEQRQSESLGFQNTDCLNMTLPSPQLAFFSCNKSIENQRTISLTRDGFNFNDLPSGNTVVPYMGGLLQVDDFSSETGGFITSTSYDNNQVVFSDKNVNFKATYDNPKLITDSQDKTNSRFIYYDNSKKAYLFENLHDNPKELDLTKYTHRNSEFSFDFSLEGTVMHVYNGLRYESGAGFADEHPVSEDGIKGQTILSFDFGSETVRERISLPDNLLVDRFIAHKDAVAFSAYNTEEGKIGMYILPRGAQQPQLAFYAQPLDLCYKDSLFYLSDDNAIYEYSSSNKASYLAYESLNHNPVNLNCLYGDISFPAQTKEGGDSDYTWSYLTNGTLKANQTRAEDLFPILDGTAYKISYAYLFKNTIRVVLKGNGVCGTVDNETKNLTLSHLKDLGINTAAFTIGVSYDC